MLFIPTQKPVLSIRDLKQALMYNLLIWIDNMMSIVNLDFIISPYGRVNALSEIVTYITTQKPVLSIRDLKQALMFIS